MVYHNQIYGLTDRFIRALLSRKRVDANEVQRFRRKFWHKRRNKLARHRPQDLSRPYIKTHHNPVRGGVLGQKISPFQEVPAPNVYRTIYM